MPRSVKIFILVMVSWLMSPIFISHAATYDEVCAKDDIYAKWVRMETAQLMKKAENFELSDKLDSAAICYSIVIDRYEQADMSDKEKHVYVRALNNLGYIRIGTFSEYGRGLALLLRSAEISEQIGYRENLAYVYMNMGGMYLICNQIYGKGLFAEEVWDYSEKGLDIAIETKQWEVALVCMVNMGTIYPSNQQKQRFLNVYKRFENAHFPSDVPRLDFYSNYLHGMESFVLGNYEDALVWFRKLANTVEPNSMMAARYDLLYHTSMAETYNAMQNYDEAISETLICLQIARANNVTDEVTKAYLSLSNLYDKTGRPDKASSELFNYYVCKDSLFSARDVSSISRLPLNMRIERMTSQIEQEQLKKKKMLIISAAIGVVALLLSLCVILLLRSRRRQRRFAHEIYLKHVALMEADAKERELRQSLEHELEALRSHYAAGENKQNEISNDGTDCGLADTDSETKEKYKKLGSNLRT